ASHATGLTLTGGPPPGPPYNTLDSLPDSGSCQIVCAGTPACKCVRMRALAKGAAAKAAAARTISIFAFALYARKQNGLRVSGEGPGYASTHHERDHTLVAVRRCFHRILLDVSHYFLIYFHFSVRIYLAGVQALVVCVAICTPSVSDMRKWPVARLAMDGRSGP
ncbi:MAG: hypothetical protein ACPIOQ_42330, partial [Promethearchaeia archaeon]